MNPYVITHLHNLDELESQLIKLDCLYKVTKNMSQMVSTAFTQVLTAKKQAQQPWYFPTQMVSNVKDSYSDVDEAMTTFVKHTPLLHQKVVSIQRVIEAVIMPQIEILKSGGPP